MKKSLLLTMIFLFIAGLSYSQRVILDFEGDTPDFQTFGADNWTGDPQFSVIANPDMSGINPSDSVGQYLEPNEGEPWMGMFFDPVGPPIDLTAGQTELCASVWVSDAATLTIKVERGDGSFAFEPAPIPVNTTGEWVQICQDFAGTDADGQSIDRVVLFFNIATTPTDPLIHYFDDIVQPGAVSTSTSDPLNGQIVSVFPNPASDRLTFDFGGTNPATVTISDIMGKQLLLSRAVTSNTLDISDISPGVYFVTLRDENSQIISTKKVIKQ